MLKKIKKNLKWIVLIVIGVALTSVTVLGILFLVAIFSESLTSLSTPFFVAATILLGLGLYILFKNRRQIIQDRQLIEENKTALGVETVFFDLLRFQFSAHALRNNIRNIKKPQTVVCFTFSPITISSNPEHNDAISSINYTVSKMISEFFDAEKDNRKSPFNTATYCFNRGYFLMYLFVDEAETQTLCETFSKKIYDTCSNNRGKIYVQPFFGIAPTNSKESLNRCIENAVISRNHGEEMFEMYTTFDPSFRVQSTESEIAEIVEALDNQEFVVYYQPKFSLNEKEFISCEALVRWDSPKHGLLSPISFIERAEHAGLISQIDLYVFEKTLQDIAEMRLRGHRVIPVSVNFSLYEFFSPSFLDIFMGLLEKYKVPPTLIEVEITETTSQANQFMSIQIIKRLKDKGVRVLMDDFGIGYSGIDNLRKIPFDAIKIDKSFTDLLVEDEKTRSIINLIIQLGHLNDIEVIIEGVDNQEQVDILRKMHIDTIQGFYYSRPIPLNEFEALLKENAFEKGSKK